MSANIQRHPQKWFVYFVTVSFGIAFSLIILRISWDNALENNRREFKLQSVSLKESVLRNVTAADNAISGIASFFLANQELTESQFNIVVDELLQQHSYIDGVVYSRVIRDAIPAQTSVESFAENNGPIVFFVQYQRMRDSKKLLFKGGHDLYADEVYGDSVKRSLLSDTVMTTAIADAQSTIKDYWMFKALGNTAQFESNNNQGIAGIIAVLVGTEKLLGSTASNSDLSIIMFNDTASLSGRQLLLNKQAQPETTRGWTVDVLNEDDLTHFTGYSIKLSISKNVYWQDVDKDGVYIALLIGIGGILLLVALERAKDLQAKALQERNLVIEQKVEEQTKELAMARDHALDSSRMKSEFLASMSHEIRTPLNAIIGMSELLNETTLTSEQDKYISVFRKAGDTLLALVNDILDLSKIEANQLVLENINFNLVEMVEESVEIYAHKAAAKGIELLSEIDININPSRIGDPTRLRQIILNLISNALKFTEDGEIVVRVEMADATINKERLHFSVIDTGIGIPKIKLEAIFQSFTQVDSSTTRKYGGTGLGLTISRSLTEMMGGEIRVESEENKGSTFHFTADLEVSKKDVPVQQVAVLDGKRILVVDDNATNRLIVNKQLTSQGAEVEEADNADTALEKIDIGKDSNPYDMILVDCQMPGKDGFELIESLKSIGQKLNTIMMLSSADLSENLSKAKGLGISQYLIKPVKQRELILHVSNALSDIDYTKQKKELVDNEDVEVKPLSILLVDDNSDNRLLINAYLKKLPYRIDEAENGQVGVDKFKQKKYDVVLMDVQMPVMDGHEATRTIRAWEKETGKLATVIISLTAHAIKEEIDKCLAAGCDTHLSKPVKKSTLIDTLQSITE